jgi:hypothetical protein
MVIRRIEHPGFTDIVTRVGEDHFVTQPTLKGGCIAVGHADGFSLPRIRHSAGVAEDYEPVGVSGESICTAEHGWHGPHVRWAGCPVTEQ